MHEARPRGASGPDSSPHQDYTQWATQYLADCSKSTAELKIKPITFVSSPDQNTAASPQSCYPGVNFGSRTQPPEPGPNLTVRPTPTLVEGSDKAAVLTAVGTPARQRGDRTGVGAVRWSDACT